MHGTPVSPVTERTAAARIAERDGRVCCLTGLGDSFWDPLLVYPIFPDIAGEIDTAVKARMMFRCVVGAMLTLALFV